VDGSTATPIPASRTRLWLLQDGDVRVGVFPEGEEFLIFCASLGGVALRCLCSPSFKVSQCSYGFVQDEAGVVEDFLDLGSSQCGLIACQQRLAADIDGIEVEVEVLRGGSEFVGGSRGEHIYSVSDILRVKCNCCTDRWQVVELHNRIFGETLVQIVS